MRKIYNPGLFFLFLATGLIATAQPMTPAARNQLIARGAALELKTTYKAPPGDALSHNTAGYAKIMCSAVFITGLSPEFAAENVGYFAAPYAERAKVGKPVIDYARKSVSITLPNGITRTAIYTGDQGCVCLPQGSDSFYFKPIKVPRNLPDVATTPWPMGDLLPATTLPATIDLKKVSQAIDAAFEPAEAQTAAFVITYKGQIIGERYGNGINSNTPLESWSMGKSLSATIMGTLIKGVCIPWNNPPQFHNGRAKMTAVRKSASWT